MSDKVKDILSKYKTIAMVGVSKDDRKPSTIVMRHMQEYGFKVIPVNPRAKGEKILGEEVFAKLENIKTPVDIVDVFRPSEEAEEIANQTIKVGASVLWLQLDIQSEKARDIVMNNKIYYIANKCTKIEFERLFRGI